MNWFHPSLSTPFETARDQVDALLDSCALRVHFQAIADLTSGEVLGYEALTRCPQGAPFTGPEQLFHAAWLGHRLEQLNSHCLELAVASFMDQALPGRLFLNTTAQSLIAADSLTGLLQPEAGRVVLEISEKYPFEDLLGVSEVMAQARQQGFTVALDDLGAGYSGLKTWSLVRPDFVKLDRYFITDIHRDGVKREFVRSIAEIARGLGCKVIAEGIETEEELDTLRAMQIRYGQGFLLHRPEAEPAPGLLNAPVAQSAAVVPPVGFAETVAAIVVAVDPVGSEVPAEQVSQLFHDNPSLTSLPVVENGRPLGIISRRHLMESFATRFSHALNWRKPIGEFVELTLVVDREAPLQEVSRHITDSDAWDISLDIIITRQGLYAGVGRVSDLLRHFTNLQIRNARYSNPLTQLPGNVPIYEQIDELLRSGTDFRLAYIDINDFKPFNDHYGYSLGDEVITCLAAVILAETDRGADFVGHIGGDDFVVLFRSGPTLACCEAIIRGFAARTRSLYAPDDLAAGGVPRVDRQGREQGRALLSLAIGVVHPDPRACRSHHEVAALAAEAKHEAKRLGGNQLFVSRRRVPGRESLPAYTRAC